jgi:uncharacterized protein YndB with AHSA1/START domain
MGDERVIDLSVDVPATAQEAWDAIATGQGISSWFVPCEVEEREGGSVTMDFGELGTDTARVSHWEPPHRFAYRTKSSSEGRELTYEWRIEPIETELTTIRLLNSGFAPAGEADADHEGLSGGWPIFLENLRLHLTHFSGTPARAITPTVTLRGGHERAWAELCGALDVPVDLSRAAHFATSGEGVPMLSGTVEETVSVPRKVSAYVLLIDAPGSGTAFVAAEGDGDEVACSVWLYLHDSDADEVEDRWSPFLEQRWASA